MGRRKPCVLCGAPKRAGHPLHCTECWLSKQPIETQVAHARRAREVFDEKVAAVIAEHPGFTVKRPPKETWPDGRAWCAGCARFRRASDFGKGATQCKPCVSARSHASMVKRTYGEGVDYDAMYAEQGGKCAICRGRQLMRRLAVHHDHVTGQAVALCCKACNHDLLGAAHDSAQILLRAYALQVGGWEAVRCVLAAEEKGDPQWNPATDGPIPF